MNDEEARLDLFWHYVHERRMAECSRRNGDIAPWSSDPIIQKYRFTNVYRASDRVSQYLIRDVQYAADASPDPKEVVFRTLLFRIFNLPSTYEALKYVLDEHPSLARWSTDRYGMILDELHARGHKLWSGAYMMTGKLGEAKHTTFLGILNTLVRNGDHWWITENASKPEHVYAALHQYDLISDFLSMQFTTDLGYAWFTDWDENDFIVPGHGARRGAYKLFGDAYSAEAVIDGLLSGQYTAFQRRGWEFEKLGGKRPLSKMDIQNCLCEFDKYCRVARSEWKTPYDRSANPLPKARFDPEGREPLPAEFYPPKWNINNG
jgi:hypothetical protein